VDLPIQKEERGDGLAEVRGVRGKQDAVGRWCCCGKEGACMVG